ncbi:hypothetical protein B0O99DRAFT_684518 [Bisporella sp. PMI_857]|nr:hypothetical protein B0O99DRAFT_684518 [Bisporella sp. PMI_857]
MSYQDHNGGYPPPRDQNESQYPPPPGEEDDRARAYHQRAPSSGGTNITLPSISSQYDPQYAQPPPNGYPSDPRAYGQPDPYRQPPPPGPYQDSRQYQPDYGRGAPQQHMTFNQSAPRQRTAIACRYCRRRKIRCSGFEQNPEGRCVNCQRFQQECIFTPVSSQAQAFVPAHALYPNMRPGAPPGPGRTQGYPHGTQLYGAHGQPLGTIPYQNSGSAPHGGSPYSDYAQPSPTSSYSSYTEDRDRSQPPQDSSRKRPQQEPHPSILPPPVPGQQGYPQTDTNSRRPAAQDDLRLPPVTPTSGPQHESKYSPGSSTSSHSALQPPQTQSNISSRTPPPRGSPSEGGRSDPMSLGNIMGGADIDSGMKNRLNRKGKDDCLIVPPVKRIKLFL